LLLCVLNSYYNNHANTKTKAQPAEFTRFQPNKMT